MPNATASRYGQISKTHTRRRRRVRRRGRIGRGRGGGGGGGTIGQETTMTGVEENNWP